MQHSIAGQDSMIKSQGLIQTTEPKVDVFQAEGEDAIQQHSTMKLIKKQRQTLIDALCTWGEETLNGQ